MNFYCRNFNGSLTFSLFRLLFNIRIFVLMRKVIAITTFFLYICLSTIQVVSLHYCHGKLQSFAISKTAKSCCTLPDGKHVSCCEDIVIRVDFKSDHVYSERLSINEPFEFDIFSDNYTELDIPVDNSIQLITEKSLIDFTPPDIYTLTHSYLFYG